MLGIAIYCIQHSQGMLERGVCELAHSFFHFGKFFGDFSVIHDVQLDQDVTQVGNEFTWS